MKTHRIICIVALIVTLVCLVGCAESGTNVGSLHVNLERASRSRALVPGETPLEIARYAISGIGPQGATFAVSSTTKSVDIDGLLLGDWKIRAIGQNKNQVDLVEGTTQTVVGPTSNIVIIELDELIGKGTLNLTLTWSALEIANPSTTVQLIDSNGNSRTLVPVTNNASNGSVTYQELLNAGSYTLTAKLKSGDIIIAGFADFVRIVSNRPTDSLVDFHVDDYTQLPTSVTMVDHLGTPVECEIVGVPEEVTAYEPMTVTITSEDNSIIDATWYLDGEEIGQGMECTFTTSIGSHRLDVLAEGSLLASLGSATITFEAKILGPKGVPILLRNIPSSTDMITIDRGCIVELLPNKIVVIANNNEEAIHVCRIVRDSLEVIHTYTKTMPNYYTKKIVDIYYDPCSSQVIISDEAGPQMALYTYNPDTYELIPRFVRNNHSITTGLGDVFYFDKLVNFKLDQLTGNLYGLHPGTNQLIATAIYATTEEGLDINEAEALSSTAYEISDWDTSPSSDHTVFVSVPSNFLVVASRTPGLGWMFGTRTRYTSSDPYITGVRTVCFIGEKTFVYSTANYLVRATYTSDNKSMIQQGVYGIGDSMGTAVGITQMVTDPTMRFLYTLSPSKKALDVYEISVGNEELTHLKTIPFGSFNASRMEIAADGANLILSSATEDSLLLYQITQ